MKQYFIKHQTIEQPEQYAIDSSSFQFLGSNHGKEGPVHTSFSESISPLESAFVKAGIEVTGLSTRPADPWAGEKLGFYHGQATIARAGSGKGKRSYSARDYLLPASNRPNLKVVLESTIVRIVLDGGKATGVEFMTGGNRHVVGASKEVIVCGGVIGSPQMLELSGIGNPEILQKAGVECLIDLPSVGEDMQDHMTTCMVQTLAPGQYSGDSFRKPEVMAMAQKAYVETMSGPMVRAHTTCGYIPAKMFLDDDELAQIVSLLTRGPFSSEYQQKQLAQTARKFQSEASANFYVTLAPVTMRLDQMDDQREIYPMLTGAIAPEDPDAVTWQCSLQYCGSRGSTHIGSSEPFAHPTLDPAYGSNEADVILRGAAYRFLEKFSTSSSLQEFVGARQVPGPDVDLTDRHTRREEARKWQMGQYHLVGSCAMGHTVDSSLRVKGTKGLRVVDASVFPGHISGNPIGTVYAVAEKGAAMIREDWK
jgi:choline dehydrogenase-like flavoprotein